jgi:Lipid A 3-O-deacylase (PagL)
VVASNRPHTSVHLRRRRVRTPVALLVVLLTLPGRAQAQALPYENGALDFGFAGGGALPVDWLDATSERRLALVAFEFGRMMTGPIGPGPLAGQFEILLQAMPIVVRGPQDFWGVGLTPLFLRWNFTGTARVKPYVEAAGGLMLIDWETPGLGRGTRNFNEQIGFGVRIGGTPRRSLMLGYRYQHISNGSPDLPSPGVDTHLLYAGLSIVR